MKRIYLDHSATSPLRPEVREAMLPWLDAGNPSSLHAEGRAAKASLDTAREIISERIGCLFAELLFTSGGTESANLALLGAALANEGPRRTILVSAAEHHCVLHAQGALESLGYDFQTLPVNDQAQVEPAALANALTDDVFLVSIMHANNELGTLNTIRPLSDLTHASGALFHCDAVQSFGKLPVKVDELGVDLLTLTAHKIGGPKGAGALYLRAGTKIKPLVVGGGQEREVRGGTENVAAIVGFGEAVRVPIRYDSALRDQLRSALTSGGAVATVRSETAQLPTHVHVRFPGIDAETMLIRLDREGISASSGAACSSGSVEPSHVLLACGFSESESKQGLRFTLGPDANSEMVDEAATRILRVAASIQSTRPVPSP